MNRLVRDPESGRSAPIMPGTVSRWAVGPAGGLSWLQISGVTNSALDRIPVVVTLPVTMLDAQILSTTHRASNQGSAVTVPT